MQIYYGAKGRGLATGAAQPDVIVFSPLNNTHLGTQLTCADVTGDGFADLLIGSPYALASDGGGSNPDPRTYTQAGRVDILYASAAYRPSGGSSPLMLDVTSASNLTMTGAGPFEWFGYHTAVLPNASSAVAPTLRELLGGVAAAGAITACVARTGYPSSSSSSSSSLDAPLASGSSVLLVGSPGYRITGASGPLSVGRLAAYLLPYLSTPEHALWQCVRSHASASDAAAPLTPLWSITADPSLMKGPTIATKLGIGFDVGYPLGQQQGPAMSGAAAGGVPHVALGMPNIDMCNSSALLPGNGSTDVFNTSAGAVAVFALTSDLRGEVTWTSLTSASYTRAVLYSRLPDARFGWRVGFADVIGADGYDDLIVSAPLFTPLFIGRGTDLPASTALGAPDSGREAGSILAYAGGAASFPSGTMCAAETAAPFRADGATQFGRLGSSWTVAQWPGAPDGKQHLIASAPRASVPVAPAANHSIEMPGAVYVF